MRFLHPLIGLKNARSNDNREVKTFHVYIMTNIHRTLYVGVTSDLVRRMYEHKEGLVEGFAKRYGLRSLVYYEEVGDALGAIRREKQIKGWLRSKKLALIESTNATWKDLSEELLGTDSSAPRSSP